LVYLATGAKNAAIRRQTPLEATANPDWMVQVLADCVTATSQGSFQARPGKQCLTCAVKTACPAVAEGKQVTA
jgi:hypothetical protein